LLPDLFFRSIQGKISKRAFQQAMNRFHPTSGSGDTTKMVLAIILTTTQHQFVEKLLLEAYHSVQMSHLVILTIEMPN
jgi:hypothetical protein